MENVVGFTGYECEDIVWYLAKILTALGKKVAIIDRTEHSMFTEFLGVKDDYFNDVWISAGTVCYEEYDTVFLLFGYRVHHPKMQECHTLILVTDGIPAHAAMLNKIGVWDRKQFLIVRNLIPMRHSCKYLTLLADCEKNYCEIDYDEKDLRSRYAMNAYSRIHIRQLSYCMKGALMSVVCFLFSEYQKSAVREVMRKI